MPLSDKEQQILQEIEKHLKEQDPEFARGVSVSLEDKALRRLRIGIALFILGFAGLFLFFISQMVLVGVAAFLLMLLGATAGYQNARKLSPDQIRSIRRATSLEKVLSSLSRKMQGWKRRS